MGRENKYCSQAFPNRSIFVQMHNHHTFIYDLGRELSETYIGWKIERIWSASLHLLCIEIVKGTERTGICIYFNRGGVLVKKQLMRFRQDKDKLWGRIFFGHTICAVKYFKGNRYILLMTGERDGIGIQMFGNPGNLFGFTEGVTQLNFNTIKQREINYPLTIGDRDYQEIKKDTQQGIALPQIIQLSNSHAKWGIIHEGKVSECNSAWDAAGQFFEIYNQAYEKQKGKEAKKKEIETELQKVENKIERLKKRTELFQRAESWKQEADLIMTHLSAFESNKHQIVKDYYEDNQPREIKIPAHLSAQEHAGELYEKFRASKLELVHITSQLKMEEEKKRQWEDKKEKLESGNLIDVISEKEKSVQKGIKEIIYEGWKIWAGRNAESNNRLTFELADKDDIWLHALGISGSHVIIKTEKKEVPFSVIEYAAGFAAFMSSAKHSSVVTVLYTKKRYVNRRKKSKLGEVNILQYKTIDAVPLKL